MKHLEPLNDRVIVLPLEETEETYGSIIIPDLGRERPEIGEVIAVGPGRMSEFGHLIKVNVEVGDKVLIPKIGTIRVEFDNKEYYVVADREILAIVNDSTT